MRTRTILLPAALGILTTLGSSWALAVWAPLKTYPPQAARHFIADGRAWGTDEVHASGVSSISWYQVTRETMSDPLQEALADEIHKRAPPFLGATFSGSSFWPTIPEEWDRFGEQQTRQFHRHISLLHEPPAWGGLARGTAPDWFQLFGWDLGFGWPQPALWYQVPGVITGYAGSAISFPIVRPGGIVGGILVTSPSSLSYSDYSFRAVPFRPIWPGLCINSATYAVAWFAVLCISGSLRLWSRKLRGLCPCCGYNLHGLPEAAKCPECGHAPRPV